MTLYVDPLWTTEPSQGWPHFYRSHLYAHTEDIGELHDLAAKLTLRRKWFTYHPRLCSYDLPPAERRKALRMGAVFIEGEKLERLLAIRIGVYCAHHDRIGQPCPQIASHWTPSRKYAYCDAHCECQRCHQPVEAMVLYYGIYVCPCIVAEAERIVLRKKGISSLDAVSSSIWQDDETKIGV